jgi:hypothetical protein
MNKKAIMVKFLVTVVLALIIFTPTCIFTSKFFRVSAQAQNNFADLVSVLDDLADSSRDDVRREFLIMDVDTSIVVFKKDTPHPVAYGGEACKAYKEGHNSDICEGNKYWATEEIVGRGPVPGGGHVSVEVTLTSTTYPYPSSCNNKDCICLCDERTLTDREVSKTPATPLGSYKYAYNHQTAQCQELDCRTLKSDVEEFHYYRKEDDSRRVVIQMEKKNDVITISTK